MLCWGNPWPEEIISFSPPYYPLPLPPGPSSTVEVLVVDRRPCDLLLQKNSELELILLFNIFEKKRNILGTLGGASNSAFRGWSFPKFPPRAPNKARRTNTRGRFFNTDYYYFSLPDKVDSYGWLTLKTLKTKVCCFKYSKPGRE